MDPGEELVDMELYYNPKEPREGVDRFARLKECLTLKCLFSLGD